MSKKIIHGIKEHNVSYMAKYHSKFITSEEDKSIIDVFHNLYDQNSFKSEAERQKALFDFTAGYIICHMLFNPNI